MSIRRESSQTSASLEGFYEELLESEHDSQIGTAMLAFLRAFDERFPDRQVWGLTSHYQLWLLACDDWRSPWLVSVIGNASEFSVEYRMPSDEAPWADALVRGSAPDLRRALDLVAVAMERSGGWR